MKKNKDKIIAELQAETQEKIKLLEEALALDLADIEMYDENDSDLLKELMLDNFDRMMEVSAKSSSANYQLNKMYRRRNSLIDKKNLTVQDILENLKYYIDIIVLFHGGILIGIISSSSNLEELLKRIITFLTTSLLALDIDLLYTTSDFRQSMIDTKLQDLEKSIKINELTTSLCKIIKEFYQREMSAQHKKLMEIKYDTPNSKEVKVRRREIL